MRGMSVRNSRKRTSWQSVRFRPGLNENKKDTGDIFLSKNHCYSFIFQTRLKLIRDKINCTKASLQYLKHAKN